MAIRVVAGSFVAPNGGGLADIIYGDSNDNTINGNGGNDLIKGGGGDDVLSGNAGNDLLYGNAGDDQINGNEENDELYGGEGEDSISGGDGADLIHGGGGDDHNSAGHTGLLGNAGEDVIYGDSGSDYINGGEDSDNLYGGAGGDTIIGGLGSDRIFGGGGDDIIDESTDNDGLGDNYILGNAGDDTITGGTGNEMILGGPGDDNINGNAGNDIMIGGEASESGGDTISYAGRTLGSGASINLTILILQDVDRSGASETDTILNFENIIGTSYNDLITGNDEDNLIQGGDGADMINCGLGSDTVSYSSGSTGVTVSLATDGNGVENDATSDQSGGHAEGDDIHASCENLIGSSGNDNLTGDANDNIIEGGAGNDVINCGAHAQDTVSYASASGSVTVNLATVGDGGIGGSGDQTTGGAGIDDIALCENLTGSPHDDTLTGDGNANAIVGGEGDDTLVATLGVDTLNGGVGTDTASFVNIAGPLSFTLVDGAATVGDTSLIDIENLIGSSGNDSLTGDDNDNIIDGGGGEDTLDGGEGAETTGDTLSYASITDVDCSVTASLANVNQGGTISLEFIFDGICDVAGNLDTASNFENLIGGPGADVLTGDDNDNIIEGGAGGDEIVCGEGADTVSYASSDGGVFIAVFGGLVMNAHADGDSILECENIIGSAHDDQLYDDFGDNIIQGGDGSDSLLYSQGGSDIFDVGNDDDIDNVHIKPMLDSDPVSIRNFDIAEDTILISAVQCGVNSPFTFVSTEDAATDTANKLFVGPLSELRAIDMSEGFNNNQYRCVFLVGEGHDGKMLYFPSGAFEFLNGGQFNDYVAAIFYSSADESVLVNFGAAGDISDVILASGAL